MQLHQAKTSHEIKSVGDDGGSNVRSRLATLDAGDFSSVNRDEVLALLKSARHRERTIWMVAGALVAGFGLGWAGGFGWYGPASVSAFNPIAQTDMPSHRSAETKSGRKTEGARKTASTLALRAPPGVSQISGGIAGSAAKPLATSSDTAVDTSSIPSLVSEADPTPTGSIPRTAPIMPMPETRPTTIEGWTVLDVRGTTAVLGGPDGIRTVARGDTVPGIGRVDSIVRWGNRWIVATDSGLIATQ